MKRFHFTVAFYLKVRIVLMILLQFLTYFFFFKQENGFQQSGFYWATQLSIINIILLIIMMKANKHFPHPYVEIQKGFNKGNSLLFLKLLIPLFIVAMAPNIILSILIYQDPQIGTTFLIGDIPKVFLFFNIIFFPILQGLVEIPFYFKWIMPQLKPKFHSKWIYIGLPIFFLSIQHAFMPLRLDIVYMIYRSLMFLPFAIMIGILLDKKQGLLPYLMILHVLMNSSLFIMQLF
jgi:hypothetical protein